MGPLIIQLADGSGAPVYGQIAAQIRVMIASGDLPAGYRLPPVRTLASDLGVNLNTVARAYRVLSEEGFVVLQERSAATVAPPGPMDDPTALERLRSSLRATLARLRQAGVPTRTLREMVDQEINSLNGSA